MTETATVSWPLMHTKVAKLGSSGPLIPGMSAKVVMSDGKLAKEGERGELWVKGPCLAMGYYENPKAYVGRIHFLSCPQLSLERQKPLWMDGCEQGTKYLSRIWKCTSLTGSK